MLDSANNVDPAQQLKLRRELVDALAESIEALGPGADTEKVGEMVADALAKEEMGFLSSLDGGIDRLVTQSMEDYARYVPSIASNAQSAAGLVRILLLQNVDLVWWEGEVDLETDDDARHAPGYLDLVSERRRGKVQFGFGVASDGLIHRGRDYVIQRLQPNSEPRGPGLPFTTIRPAMLGVLNEIAIVTSEQSPVGTPRIWVNSIVRSIEHQHRLRALGFSALHPSAHCRGWAADIEVMWFKRFGADDALREVLLDYLDRGILNVIDEGRAWHVCLAPDFAAHYAAIVSG